LGGERGKGEDLTTEDTEFLGERGVGRVSNFVIYSLYE
jgi:hypothetical protein